jgi:hypothetical protein
MKRISYYFYKQSLPKIIKSNDDCLEESKEESKKEAKEEESKIKKQMDNISYSVNKIIWEEHIKKCNELLKNKQIDDFLYEYHDTKEEMNNNSISLIPNDNDDNDNDGENKTNVFEEIELKQEEERKEEEQTMNPEIKEKNRICDTVSDMVYHYCIIS